MSSRYAQMSKEEQDNLLSGFMIDSWSYSKVASFARNEKSFEKEEIFGERGRRSAASVAGNAYHEALKEYFLNLKDGIDTGLTELQGVAYAYIDGIPANWWKLQKTTPTVEACIMSANKDVNALLLNFYREKDIYLGDLSDVLNVEVNADAWVTVNGVDIPMPCHSIIDLIIRTSSGRCILIDHKSVRTYTSPDEVALTRGKQAITYVKTAESVFGIHVDEVRFVENKAAANKDKSPQLKQFSIAMDEDTRKLYEAMLYEPLRRMIQAVSDPDYVYMVNDSDSFADRAEIYDFWVKTMISEVDDFNVPDNKKELVSRRLRKIRDSSLVGINPRVITAFRKNAASFINYDYSNMDNKEKIEHVLRTFGIGVKVTHEISGYSSNTYLLEVSAGVRISNIMNYRMDIANALNVPSVRILPELSVYDGKSYLAIESSKKRTQALLWDVKYLEGMRIPLGVDNFGRTVVWDISNHSTPHMLICGATGSGKSVSILSTIEYARKAGISDIVIMDPKYEFTGYSSQSGIRVFNDIPDIEAEMKRLVGDMQSRASHGSTRLTLVVFDEFADAVQSSRQGKQLDIRETRNDGFYANGMPKTKEVVVGREKSLEENMRMLLQKGRSLGFRIIAATQRASAKIITGDAKVNFPVQVCFRVPKEVDSKVVLDEAGAETLQGQGDGLVRSPEYMGVVRFQGFYYKE